MPDIEAIETVVDPHAEFCLRSEPMPDIEAIETGVKHRIAVLIDV